MTTPDEVRMWAAIRAIHATRSVASRVAVAKRTPTVDSDTVLLPYIHAAASDVTGTVSLNLFWTLDAGKDAL